MRIRSLVKLHTNNLRTVVLNYSLHSDHNYIALPILPASSQQTLLYPTNEDLLICVYRDDSLISLTINKPQRLSLSCVLR